jgi:hypothetical protein
MSHERLSTYLNDHLAGAAAGLEMVSTLAAIDGHRGWADALRAEIEQDRTTLEALMQRLNIQSSTVRQSTGWLAEKFARLKTRLDDTSGGALQQLELLEALSLGIEGKRSLWTALQTAAADNDHLRSVDYDTLIERAQTQRRTVEVQRLQAAADALTMERSI